MEKGVKSPCSGGTVLQNISHQDSFSERGSSSGPSFEGRYLGMRENWLAERTRNPSSVPRGKWSGVEWSGVEWSGVWPPSSRLDSCEVEATGAHPSKNSGRGTRRSSPTSARPIGVPVYHARARRMRGRIRGCASICRPFAAHPPIAVWRWHAAISAVDLAARTARPQRGSPLFSLTALSECL